MGGVAERSGGIQHLTAAAVLLAVGLALRWPTFGDPNLFADEPFYLLVGQKMHEGLLPYVDIWDRKPPGLFLIYYLIAGLPDPVVGYQIVAALVAVATAWIIHTIALRFTDRRGAILAGAGYLVMLNALGGGGGQSPVFYNLPIAAAVLIVLRQRDILARGRAGWPIAAAMALCGLAITIKQSALFESIFLGLYVILALHRSGQPWARLAAAASAYALIGALPMLVFAAWYAAIGHWADFWHAMVTANLSKTVPIDTGFGIRVVGTALRLVPFLAVGAFGTLGLWRRRPPAEMAAHPGAGLIAGWLIAATLALLAVPNFYPHYALPMLPPLAIGAGMLFGQTRGLLIAAALILYALLWNDYGDPRQTARSQKAMQALTDAVRAHDGGGGLLVYMGPPRLHATTGKPFLSRLVFPAHLNSAAERDTSPLKTDAEIDRILAARPGVVVMSRGDGNEAINRYAAGRVRAYVTAHCRVVAQVDLFEPGAAIPTVVHGDCR